MLDTFLHISKTLIEKNEPFALAVVVRREAPSSSKIGDKAIVNKYGKIFGWVGGGCVKGILVKESEDALRTGKPRLVKIGKSIIKSNQENVMEYKMTCQSEGKVEVYIEPVLPKVHLVVIGKSEIAKALVSLASTMQYKITGVAQGADLQTFEKVDELITQVNSTQIKTTPSSFIIVSTQGEGDEKALIEALKKERTFLGFVSSSKKAKSVKEYLISSGLKKEEVQKIIAPVGIDIKAKKPKEVAISIIAQMIQHINTHPHTTTFKKFEKATSIDEKKSGADYYINPVCNIPIDKNNPKYIIEYKGEKVYFCCDGCKVKFEANPEKYIKIP